MKTIFAALSLLILAHPALGDDYNPFLGKAGKSKAAQKEKVAPLKPAAAPATPPLPPLAVPAAAPAPNFHSAGADKPAERPGDVRPFVVTGRIGDQVVVVDRSGMKAIIQDGTMRGGCFVKYPEVFCEKADIAQAKKDFVAEAKAKADEEAAETAKAAKAGEPAAALIKMQEKLEAAQREIAAGKTELAAAKVQIDAGKADALKARTQVDELTRQLSDLKQANLKLMGSNTEMAKQLSDAAKVGLAVEGEKARTEELVKQLKDAATEKDRLTAANAALTKRVSEAEKDLADLKSSIAAPPVWVKGIAKHYKDPTLGEVEMSKADNQVFFRVSRAGEDPADKLFGHSVVRKERKGDYTYYALNAHNVRVKE